MINFQSNYYLKNTRIRVADTLSQKIEAWPNK